MKAKWVGIVVIFAIFLNLPACSTKIKTDYIYVLNQENEGRGDYSIYTPINTNGINPFQEISYKDNYEELYPNMIIAVSKDNNTIFIMEERKNETVPEIIKGEPEEKVNLIRFDVKEKKSTVILENIPFISRVKWNQDETYIAFNGGGQLRVYDLVKSKFVLEQGVENNEIDFFEWSIDGKKIYTEHTTLANDGIWYVDSDKILNAYETKENVYYKGKLDEQYFYGTKNSETSLGIISKTVLVNDKGEIMDDFPQGRFRDSYERSMIEIGEKRDGLLYFSDINRPREMKAITKDRIYDCKFVYSGKVAYIIKDNDIEKNNYLLCIVNKQGIETARFEISGNTIALRPDGRSGYVGGPKHEKIDFVNEAIEDSGYNMDIDKELAIRTILGGMDIYYKYSEGEEKDIKEIDKYFTNSHNPEQWALFDISNSWESSNDKTLEIRKGYETIYLDKYEKYNESGAIMASVMVHFISESMDEAKSTGKLSIELIKENNKWYITGISTFPNYKEFEHIRTEVEQDIKLIQDGTMFNGMLKGKKITLGQIQFWLSSTDSFSANVEESDSIKTYLTVSENGKDEMYKLVLQKNAEGKWVPLLLSKEGPYSLE